MKIKVPSQVRVSSYVYNIVVIDELERDFHLLGQCLSDKGIMKIECSSIPTVKDVSLLHELVHAVNDVYGCGLDDANIDRIAHGLTDVLKNSFGIEFEWNV